MPEQGPSRVAIRRRADQVLWQVTEHYTRDDITPPTFDDAYCYVVPDGPTASGFRSLLKVGVDAIPSTQHPLWILMDPLRLPHDHRPHHAPISLSAWVDGIPRWHVGGMGP